MRLAGVCVRLVLGCLILPGLLIEVAAAKNLCVNPGGSKGCYATIQSAVTAASANDVINVWPGTYKEDVVVGKPLALLGAGAGKSVIDASNLPNGILLDGLDNPGLQDVTVAGFTVAAISMNLRRNVPLGRLRLRTSRTKAMLEL